MLWSEKLCFFQKVTMLLNMKRLKLFFIFFVKES